MRSNFTLFVLNLLLLMLPLTGQDNQLFVPLNISEAFNNGTRSENGEAGPMYWQNHADYVLQATVDPDSSILTGSAQITYYNQSPDSLGFLIVRLYQNILSKGVARDWSIAPDMLHDGVSVRNIMVNGDSVELGQGRDALAAINGTNMRLNLKQKLAPKSSVKVSMDYSFQIPDKVQLRMGNYGEGDLFIAYWYPQIAVYDDIDGWDRLEYTGTAEFYNDFNNYDFKITVPGNFLVWATGELQNAQENYSRNVLKRMQKAWKSDETIRIIRAEDYRANDVLIPATSRTWHFKAERVADVSFALSDNYNWDAASVEVDTKTKRRVLTAAIYPDSTQNWDEAAMFARQTIDYMSHDLPGFAYPYPHTTSFANKKGGGGMETPMMANDGVPKGRSATAGLLFHEIAHTYFPFFMGINERKYAWMDEGWATFLPRDVVDRSDKESDYLARNVRSFNTAAGNEGELPLIVPTFSVTTEYNRTHSYSRPSLAYHFLMETLGREKFKKALLVYMERWHEKHPLPWDFFNTFNNVTGEDLSWFFKPWFFEFGYPDLGVKAVSTIAQVTEVTIEKIGNLPVPVVVTVKFEDGTEQIVEKSIRVWQSGNRECRVTLKNDKKISSVAVGSKYVPDVNQGNDVFMIIKQ